jgi:hypothetical protein
VQSVVVDNQDNLWIPDPASPKMEGIVYGTRKSFPVYGSFTADPGAKALTSI